MNKDDLINKNLDNEINDVYKDFYLLSMRQNEYRINSISGALDLALLVGAIILFFLNYIGVFILDSSKVGFTCLLLAPFALASFFVTIVFKIKKPWVKYMIMINECICMLIMYSMVSMHVVLLLALPIVKSTLYFNKKLTIITFIISSICILLGHILSVNLSIVFDDPIVRSLYASLVYGFIPRFLEFLLISVALFFVAKNSSKMQSDGYLYAAKAENLLEKNRKNHYEIVKNLAIISENKSIENGSHIQRVFEYMYILAKHDGASDEEAYNIGLAAMLHDVGKLGVDEKILSKPAKLTPEEYEKVKLHTLYGKNLLSSSENEILKLASTIAYEHHERWDGKGYYGMKGEAINKYSCLMSVADVFDALVSRRCYKDPWDVEVAYQEIVKGRGTQFSPHAVDLFIECFDEFKEVFRKYEEKK